ncbi:hypothetical protein P7K49_025663, partial [Saguinus oedipus]
PEHLMNTEQWKNTCSSAEQSLRHVDHALVESRAPSSALKRDSVGAGSATVVLGIPLHSRQEPA